jgi:hypothetical protein
MSEEEKKEILDELEKRFDEKYKGILTKEDVYTVLKEPRNKWFRDDSGNGHDSLMTIAFGSSIVAWQMWEEIRKLTCRICGKSYVRQLEDSDNAEEVAERLCELVYKLAMDRKGVKEKC